MHSNSACQPAILDYNDTLHKLDHCEEEESRNFIRCIRRDHGGTSLARSLSESNGNTIHLITIPLDSPGFQLSMISNKIEVLQRYRDANKAAHPDDKFNKLFGEFSDGSGIKNMGGSRIRKSTHTGNVAFSVLITNANEPEWPDKLDATNSSFLYYGDKRGEYGLKDDLHNTAAKGNSLLRDTFFHLAKQERHKIPPFLLFRKMNEKNGVYMHFLGLAAPALSGVNPLSCLKAVWHQGMDGGFCMNYEAYFTILDASEVAIQWLDDILQTGNFTGSSFCPWAWKVWVNSGSYPKLSFEKLLLSSC